VWWDYRDWTSAMRVPAVVGSFPEPLRSGYGGRRHPVKVVCGAPGAAPACASTRGRLRQAGVAAAGGGGEPIRVLVGPWGALRGDPAAALLQGGPDQSGVFARFVASPAGAALELLDTEGRPRRELASAGLVAAVRAGENPPTWLVTGTGTATVADAAAALSSRMLRDRYAVAVVAGHGTIPVPR
jgi:hypothetical protein